MHQEIERMNEVASHRGPDGRGSYFDGCVGLGHLRLSILDLSDAGHQPMCYNKRFWITYNGEVYNYIELRAELIKLGYNFNSGTDTEVILAAWQEWGQAAFSKFNGMWSLAIYDVKTKQLILSRDRFGVKPMHYCWVGSKFIFASEIKQLICAGKPPRGNLKCILSYLIDHSENIGAETMFEGVFSLPGGHVLKYDTRNHKYSIEQYYFLPRAGSDCSLPKDEIITQFRLLLEDSIRLRMRSDVRVGTCLSGGLDSSVIATISSRIFSKGSGEQFLGVHARASESTIDEFEYARLVSISSDIDLKVVSPSTEDFLTRIDEVVFTQEEPFGSPSMFMGWHVFQRARQEGCKVMLNGQGGDEVLLGYERYVVSYLSLQKPIESLKQVKALSKVSGISIHTILAYWLYFKNHLIRIQHLRSRSTVRSKYIDSWSTGKIVRGAASFQSTQSLQRSEILDLQLPHLLRYEDRNSMRHGIETRLPFLDYRLVEFCLSAPPEMKIANGWTKSLLRKSFQEVLPSRVAWRGPKLGYEAPERTWINSNLNLFREEIMRSNLIAELCDTEKLKARFHAMSLKEKWAHFNLAVWSRIYKVDSF